MQRGAWACSALCIAGWASRWGRSAPQPTLAHRCADAVPPVLIPVRPAVGVGRRHLLLWLLLHLPRPHLRVLRLDQAAAQEGGRINRCWELQCIMSCCLSEHTCTLSPGPHRPPRTGDGQQRRAMRGGPCTRTLSNTSANPNPLFHHLASTPYRSVRPVPRPPLPPPAPPPLWSPPPRAPAAWPRPAPPPMPASPSWKGSRTLSWAARKPTAAAPRWMSSNSLPSPCASGERWGVTSSVAQLPNFPPLALQLALMPSRPRHLRTHVAGARSGVPSASGPAARHLPNAPFDAPFALPQQHQVLCAQALLEQRARGR